MTRMPAVSGSFYPGRASELRRTVVSALGELQPAAAIGVVSPHAGYLYSGGVAGATFARAAIPQTVIVLGPDHHGLGPPLALYGSGSWQTPLGTVPIAAELATELLAECESVTDSPLSHHYEHSLEVQLPFLQLLNPSLHLLPLMVGHAPLPVLLCCGEALARIVARQPVSPLLVASSDMTHYETGQTAREKDERAIERILALDAEGLYRVVRDGRISMCGVLPTVIMLAAARALGGRTAELVRYANSGDVTGDQSQVVGYAGIVVR